MTWEQGKSLTGHAVCMIVAVFQVISCYTGCVIKNGHPNSTKVGAFFGMVLMFCDSIGSKRT